MLDASRRKVEQTSTEAHQLRHDKRELNVHLQDLTRRLEALKKISISASSGGDAEQIQILRNIIRKQEMELMDVRLASACKQVAKQEQDILDTLRDLGRSELGPLSSGLSRVSSLAQELRRDFESLSSAPGISSQASKFSIMRPSSLQQKRASRRKSHKAEALPQRTRRSPAPNDVTHEADRSPLLATRRRNQRRVRRACKPKLFALHSAVHGSSKRRLACIVCCSRDVLRTQVFSTLTGSPRERFTRHWSLFGEDARERENSGEEREDDRRERRKGRRGRSGDGGRRERRGKRGRGERRRETSSSGSRSRFPGARKDARYAPDCARRAFLAQCMRVSGV
uniref:Uncharacterized protein n=1 Tax=Neospora caninum (strain Liverpool) TaxID=572307 RepID=A0A0F7UGH6_NEOCL|nr:TPA: hypothetical protein BN1204_038555 [Neospora caninum Liverpool]